MNSALACELLETYERAVYEADLAGGRVVFRPGRTPEGRAPKTPLAILTAWNPGHERPGLQANERANVRLAAEIRRRGFVRFPARGRSEVGTHMEPSFAVADISRREAIAIAREFHQAAIFYWDGERAWILSCAE